MNQIEEPSFSRTSSTLDSAEARFLSLCLSAALEAKWLSENDLVETFPPEEMMRALEGNLNLRAALLVRTAGVHERIALRKSTDASAEDLRLALDEGLCDAADIFSVFTIDECVKRLDKNALWEFLIRDSFWLESSERARARLLFVIETALEQGLLEKATLLHSVSPERLSADLPRELLEDLAVHALRGGLDGLALNPENLVELLPLEIWLTHVPLVHVWESVVLGVVAPRAGLLSSGEVVVSETLGAQAAEVRESSAPAPLQRSQHSSRAKTPRYSESEKKARRRVEGFLKRVDRCPSCVQQLSTAALLGLETMYTELGRAQGDAEKEACIMGAFAGVNSLEEALFAMATTLDPRLSKDDLLTRGANVPSLVALILFEERRRVSRSQSIPPSAPQQPVMKPSHSPPPPATSDVAPRKNVGPPPAPSVRPASSIPPPLPVHARVR